MYISQNFEYVLAAVALYLLAILIPLVPAIVIYRLFPDTTVATSGPLSGLTIKASGAFAAYIVVFLLTAYSWNQTFRSIHSLASESWTVKGRVEVHDAADHKISDPRVLRDVKITFDPDIARANGGRFEVTVPDTNGDLPNLTFSIGDSGTSPSIDFSDPGEYQIKTDASTNLKTLTKPVVITLLPAQHPYGLNKPLTPLPASQTQPVLPSGSQ